MITVYHPPRITRVLQMMQFIIGICLIVVASCVGIYTERYGLFFAFVSLVLIAWILWFVCRKSYAIAFENKVVLNNKGISWRYLGVSGFASWEMLDYFDVDIERSWLNLTFSTSDYRHMKLRVRNLQHHIPLRNDDVWGIRLRETARLERTWLSNLPNGNHDFIPLSLIVKLPHHRDKSLDIENLVQSEFGEALYHYAPHLFVEYDEWKPKNRLQENDADVRCGK